MTRLLLRSTVLAVALCAATLVLVSAVATVRGARTADPVERALLAQATRLSGHQTPYDEGVTALDAPTPGLPFVVAVLLAGERPRLWHLRAIAFFATVALAVLLLAIVQLETNSWTLGTAAASLALLGASLFGPAPGEARPIELALLLVLLGATALRHTVGALGAVIAAVPTAAAWFVDPQSGWAAAALVLAIALNDGARAAWFGAVTGVLLAAGYGALSAVLGPWFNFAAWDLTWQGWRVDAQAALDFLTGAVLGRFGLCALGAVLSCAMVSRPWVGRRGLWPVLAAGTLVGALVATQHGPGDGTPLAPCLVLVCLLGTLSLQRVARNLAATFEDDGGDGENVVLAGLALQFLVLGAMALSSPWVSAVARRAGVI